MVVYTQYRDNLWHSWLSVILCTGACILTSSNKLLDGHSNERNCGPNSAIYDTFVLALEFLALITWWQNKVNQGIVCSENRKCFFYWLLKDSKKELYLLSYNCERDCGGSLYQTSKWLAERENFAAMAKNHTLITENSAVLHDRLLGPCFFFVLLWLMILNYSE